MNPQSFKHYICIKCKAAQLSIKGTVPEVNGPEIAEASLYCNQCGAIYPIKNSVPRFVPMDNYAVSFGYQWNIHKKTQLDSYTGHSISRERLFKVTEWPKSMKGQTILEAGSGAGRFTEVLLETGADVFSFDFSSAVEANYANNGGKPNLNLFQGDIYRIPLQEATFDKVICLGVIQHTPDPEKTFKSLVLHVRPGGELVIDVYAKKLIAFLQWKYILRPFAKFIGKELLYKLVAIVVRILLPLAILLRRITGRAGVRLLPIVEYSHLGLPYGLNREWSVLDTFDMYSPAHDHPQSLTTVRRWFNDAGFTDIEVRYGPNGIVGKGKKPA